MSRKNLVFLLVWSGVASLILLAGCQSAPSVTQPGITPSQTAGRATTTLIPSETPAAPSTTAPTVPAATEGTSTLQPTPTIQVPLPEISGEAFDYRLTHPSPETLIKLQLSRTTQMLYSDLPLDDLLYPAFNDILDLEWQRAYAHTQFSSNLFDLIPYFDDHSRGRLTNQMLTDLVGDQIVEAFNAEKMNLKDRETYATPNFSGQVYQIELDADEFPEWLVEVKNGDGFYLSNYSFWITLDQAENGRFARLANEIPLILAGTSINPENQIRDFSGDGITDLVLEENLCSFGDCGRIFHVAIGGPDGFRILQSGASAWGGGAGAYWAETDWPISSVNGLSMLEITSYRNIVPWDCTVSSKEEFQWIGGVEQIGAYPAVYPDTAICALAHAMDRQDPPDRSAQIQLLAQAYNHPDGLSQEHRVFVLYRLALLHALAGEDRAARGDIDQIFAVGDAGLAPIAAVLADQIRPLLSEERVYPYKLCLAAENIAKDIPEELWLTASGIPYRHPYEGFSEGYPASLCDTREILLDVLNNLDFESGIPMEKIPESAGIPALNIQPILFNDSHHGWLLLLNDTNPAYPSESAEPEAKSTNDFTYLLGNLENQGWGILAQTELIENWGSVYLNSSDLTGDDVPEISIAYPSPEQAEAGCTGEEIPYNLDTVTALYGHWLVSYAENICQPSGESVDFDALFLDKNRDGIADRTTEYFDENVFEEGPIELPRLSEIPNENPWEIHRAPYWEILKFVNKAAVIEVMTARFLASPNPGDLRPEIEYYRDRWGTEDEIGQNIQANLDYLLGWIYEFDGNPEKAAEFYFKVWHDQPDTLWAYLAASRLEWEK